LVVVVQKERKRRKREKGMDMRAGRMELSCDVVGREAMDAMTRVRLSEKKSNEREGKLGAERIPAGSVVALVRIGSTQHHIRFLVFPFSSFFSFP
jgi:hypothetical protein